jgi:hypothetical protein
VTLLALCVAATAAGGQGVVTGRVVDAEGQALGSASVRVSTTDLRLVGASVSDSTGAFRIGGLPADTYVIRVYRVGYRSAEVPNVRVRDGETMTLTLTLTQTARQLSAVNIASSPTSVDARATALTVTLDRTFTELLPSARDASGLLTLLPGSRKDQVWGGAAGVSNNYRLDGVSMNHPGSGGDMLPLSVDWLEAVDVKGLGAGAEHGDFQGGVIDARTKSGTNRRAVALRTNYESADWNSTNLSYNEQGAEQAGRREFGAEVGGPIMRDRLFYFAAGQYVSRDVRAAPLAAGMLPAVPQSLQSSDDVRGMLKLTWLPTALQRADFLVGATSARVDRDGVNGVDAPDALTRVTQPAAFGSLGWTRTLANGSVDVRLGGFLSKETRGGYLGESVPGIQVYQNGRQPRFQNAAFTEIQRPSGVSGTLRWSTDRRFVFDHELTIGADVGRTHWREDVTRNGGLTWRPYTYFARSFNPATPATWATRGSDWGAEVHVDATMWNAALYMQDNISVLPRVTLSPGLRVSRWSGAMESTGEVVSPTGLDPRIGIAWSVDERGTFAVKAHAGRYHQGMSARFFDRVSGANAYSDARYYSTGPMITDPHTTFTVAQRDAGNGFPTRFEEVIMSESGRVSKYRQPYVDQLMVSVEKSFGTKWKAELFGTTRKNRSIVGLVDRNVATNYSELHNVRVDNYFQPGTIKAPNGGPLTLPTIYFANGDLKRLKVLNPTDSVVAGYDTAYINTLTWNPDLVLTSIDQARRNYQQATLLVRTVQSRWRGEASFTAARLEGNVAGVTGYGSAGDRFSPGPFARPVEAINYEGILPDAQQLEGKLWLTARIWKGINAGVLYTHMYGETYTPEFRFETRYSYRIGTWDIPTEMLKRILGQGLLLEQRGSRHYDSRDVVDLHVEWASPFNAVLSADVFNVLGIDAVTRVNTNVGDRATNDPTSHFNAVRERVQPRTFRLGLKVEAPNSR